jgi:hypothetical protein
MVCLRLERPNADLLAVTADLAERFRSSVIGVATRHPMQFMFSGGLVPEELNFATPFSDGPESCNGGRKWSSGPCPTISRTKRDAPTSS